jgi:hypothetical protein
MSASEYIFLRTGQAVGEVARQLATLPGMELHLDDRGRPSVRRDTRHGSYRVGGQVSVNAHADPDEVTVLNGYDVMYEIWSTANSRGAQKAEAERIFEEIVERLKWPAALVFNLETLAAASSPEHGTTYFPPGTTPDEPHRRLWQDYA